jgi:hypothetical protein
MGRSARHRGNTTDHLPQRRSCLNTLTWLITGGFAKGCRTQVLGVTTALSAIALWAVGDMSLADLLGKLPIARREGNKASPQRQNESFADLPLEHDPFRKAAPTFLDHALFV